MSEEDFNERMKHDWYVGVFSDEEPYSKTYVLDVFTGWLEETEEDSEYVRFGWL